MSNQQKSHQHRQQQNQKPADNTQQQKTALTIHASRLPYPPAVKEQFDIDGTQWRALVESIFPLATTIDSIILALSYCRSRKLDPFKKPCHIVPIWNKELNRKVDTIWAGIGELRTTATRTGDYAGMDECSFGPELPGMLGETQMDYPEWAQITVYKMVKGVRCPFPGPRVRFLETYATASHNTDDPNSMWFNRPYAMLEKCAEAAALRRAFPEEIGEAHVMEEARDERVRKIIETTVARVAESKPAMTKAEELKAQMRGRLDNKPIEKLPTETAIDNRETIGANRETTVQQSEMMQAETEDGIEREIYKKIMSDIQIASDEAMFEKIDGGIASMKSEQLVEMLLAARQARRDELDKNTGHKPQPKDGKLPME